MRVRELERHLGTTLFDRSGYRARPTEPGQELIQYAERILGLAEEMEHRAGRAAHFRGRIRLGAADSFALTCLAPLLVQLEQSFPALRVDVQIDFSANLNQRLQKGDLEVAFLTGPVDGPALQVVPFVRLSLAWVASARLSQPARLLRPRDLKDAAILTNPRPSHLFRSVQTWFAGAGIEPSRLMTCNSLTIMTRLPVAGFGVTLLPTGLLRREFELGQLLRLRTRPGIGSHAMLMPSRDSLPSPIRMAIRAAAAGPVAGSELQP